jgi:putative ABC transport system permease protein
VPALAASQSRPASPLKEPDVAVGRRHRLRTGLVAAQLALALILLIGFGLLMNSFLRLTGRDLNFEPSGLLTFDFRTDAPQRPLGQYRGLPYYELVGTPAQTVKQVHERLAAIPGAESVGGISFPPVNSLILPVMDVSIEGRSARAAYFLITPNVFQTMRTRLVRGRDVSEADTVSRPWVAIVNETAARQFWPGADPLGRRLTVDVVPEEQPREVIGIVRDIPPRHGQIEPQPVIYASYLQQPSRYGGPFGGMFGQMTFIIRHKNDPLSLVPAARKAVAEIEPRPISSVLTAEQRLEYGRERIRYNLFLIGVLAGTAALLAAVGVYGMLTYSVSQRTREIGIRKALGASPHAIVMFIGRYVLAVVAAGLAVGLAGALALTRLMTSQLWGITPTDPSTYAAVSLLLVLVALLACVGPARRAIAVDATVALRSE